jgi:hypothetical protein
MTRIADPDEGRFRPQRAPRGNGKLGADPGGFAAGQRDGKARPAHGSRMMAAARSSFM